MGKRAVTNPKATCFRGLNLNYPTGCSSFYRALLDSNDLSALLFSAATGNRPVRRKARQKIHRLAKQIRATPRDSIEIEANATKYDAGSNALGDAL